MMIKEKYKKNKKQINKNTSIKKLFLETMAEMKSLSVSIPLALSFLLTPLKFNFNKTGFTPIELNKAKAYYTNNTIKTSNSFNMGTSITQLNIKKLMKNKEKIKKIVKNALVSVNKNANKAFWMLEELNNLSRIKLNDYYKQKELNQQLINVIATSKLNNIRLLDTVISLIADGADPNIVDNNKKNLLMYACDRNNLPLAKLLIYIMINNQPTLGASRILEASEYALGIKIGYNDKVKIEKEPNINFIKFFITRLGITKVIGPNLLKKIILALIFIRKNEKDKEVLKILNKKYNKIAMLLIKHGVNPKPVLLDLEKSYGMDMKTIMSYLSPSLNNYLNHKH